MKLLALVAPATTGRNAMLKAAQTAVVTVSVRMRKSGKSPDPISRSVDADRARAASVVSEIDPAPAKIS